MNANTTVLVVEDKENEREATARLLRMEGYQVLCAKSGKEAITYLDQHIDLVISDLRMGTTSGVDLLRYWKSRRSQTPFILITAFGDVDSAVEAMKVGAEDYLNKPVNPDELLMLVERCLRSRAKDEIIAELHQQLDAKLGFENIVGQAQGMLEVFEDARRAAATESTVLITGESGTGKELLARAIHHNSARKDRPFVTVNMAAVPEHLTESELFGHVKGSFTGATDSRLGRFEAANEGTIFIDEIGDFRLESQAKLLRVLENHVVTPIGSNDDRRVNTRVVAATSRDLESMVRDGDFREDLYYRLNVINLHLPALRERRDDIPLLIGHFLEEICRETDRPRLRLTPDLSDFLQTYSWPGNVRQLRNCLESMVVLARDETLTLDDLPATLEQVPNGGRTLRLPAGTTLQELEREAVEQALEQCGDNRTHAAESLGISVRTLQRKLKSWGINETDHQDE
jgi:DNA-binding NtrC family response regulator